MILLFSFHTGVVVAIVGVSNEERTKSQESDVHFTLDVTQKHQNSNVM